MKRLIYVAVAILTVSFGVGFLAYYQLQSAPMSQFDCSWLDQVSGKPGYHIHNTKSRLGDRVDFYHDFTSPEATRQLFQSNFEGDELVEQGFKLNMKGQKIGERGVDIFMNGIARIYWTEGDEFWFVQASSLKLTRQVESQCFAR